MLRRFMDWLKAVIKILGKFEEMNFLSFKMRDGEILEFVKNIENLRVKDIEGYLSIEKFFCNGVSE